MEQETVNKPYADYEWYKNEYGGSIIPEDSFHGYARRATSIIDAETYGNITSDDQVIDCVKDACCAVAELNMNYYSSTVESEGGRGKSSESNDGYSVSYDDTLSTSKSLLTECRNMIKLYLAGTGLLYRGFGKRPRRWYRG